MNSVTETSRAVSTALSYVLLLSVATVLTSGLVIAAGDMADGQQARTAESELDAIGEQLSSDLSAADRMVRTLNETSEIRVSRQFPETVSGSTYWIRVTDSPDTVGTDVALRLEAVSTSASVEIPVETDTAVDPDTEIKGGDVVVEYDGNELVITDA